MKSYVTFLLLAFEIYYNWFKLSCSLTSQICKWFHNTHVINFHQIFFDTTEVFNFSHYFLWLKMFNLINHNFENKNLKQSQSSVDNQTPSDLKFIPIFKNSKIF